MPNLCTAPRCICALALVVFALAALAGCNAPQASSSPPAQPKNDTAESIMQAYRQYGGEVVELGATAPSATVAVTDLTGTIPAYSLTQGNPPCAGYLQSLPSMIFTLAADEPAIEIALVGNTSTTLIVVAEGEKIICDESAPITLTPKLVVPHPKAGRYGVWVGRTDMQEAVNGKLTVSVATRN